MLKQKQVLWKILLWALLFQIGSYSATFWEFESPSVWWDLQQIEKEESLKYSWIIVTYKKSKVNLSNYVWYLSAQRMAGKNALEVVDTNTKLNISLLETTQDETNIEKVLQDIKKDVSVESVQPNYIYETLDYTQNNDANKDVLWGLQNDGQTIEWQAWFSGSDISWDESMQTYSGSYMNTWVVVAVLDTGVAYNHPDLINNMWDGSNCLDDEGVFLWGCIHGYDYDNNDKNPMLVSTDHGTHVAGIIAASMNNSKWVIGVNPQAKIMAVKIENMTTMEIVNAINFAKFNGAKVINASFGWYNWMDELLYNAIKNFWESGWIFVAAAGNSAKNHDLWGNNITFPAGYGIDNVFSGKTLTGLTNIISVAATDNQDNLAYFSDYGSTAVHIWAPWVSIYSTIQSNIKNVLYTENFSGTYLTGNTYGFATWGTNNNFWVSHGYYGVWGDINYPFSTGSIDSYIEKTIDTTGVKIPTLSFNIWCDAGKWNSSFYTDYMNLSFSTWGVFTTVDRIDYWHTNLQDVLTIDGKTGYYGTLTYDLTNFESNTLTTRLTWHSDNDATTDLGCMVFGNSSFPFEVAGLDDGSDEAYNYKDGTSMAAPYVAGLASLAMSYRPDLSNVSIKNAILQNGDSVASLSGKTITGKRINAYQTLLSIVPPDTTPDAFSFSGLTNQALNTSVESNPVTITGINTGTTLSVTGWLYKIGTGSYTSTATTIHSGAVITLKHTTSSNYNTSVNTTLTVGWTSAIFTSTTGDVPPDYTPNAFSFSTLTGQTLSTLVESNQVTITGINTWTLVTIVGWEYKIGTGAYTTATGYILSGNTLQLRQTTSNINATSKSTIVTIGTMSGTFMTSTYDQQESITPVSSNTGITLTGTTSVWSWFALIGEPNVNNVYVFSGSDISNFITGSILENNGNALAVVLIDNTTQLYAQSGSFIFDKKLLPWEEVSTGSIKQIFTWAIKIGNTQSILLDTPAVIQYFSDKNASKVAYRKSGTPSWTLISIESNTCSVDIQTKPVCAYRIWNEIYIKTYHFTDFALVKEEAIVTKKTSSWGWSWGSSKDYCPNGDFSNSYYDKMCGVKTTQDQNTGTWNIRETKDNNVELFSPSKITLEKYNGFEIVKIDGYKLSKNINNIAKYIINSKKYSKQEKTTYIQTLNNFLKAKYEFDTTKVKTQKLKNVYTKQVILLKNTIKKLSK